MGIRSTLRRRVALLGALALGSTLLSLDASAAPQLDRPAPAVTAAHRPGPDHAARTTVRAATRRYQYVDRAIDAGYVQFFGCVHEPLQGAMGIHFVDPGLAGDDEVRARRPEALLYEVDRQGRLRLLGVEYVVFADAWDVGHTAPPQLFGQDFHLVEEPNRYGLPAHYMLHVWAWKHNPSGLYSNWNPRVLCTGAEGHV